MKVVIIGAGAIGGLIGTRLASSSRNVVSALARGETLRALNSYGWRMQVSDSPSSGTNPVLRTIQAPCNYAASSASELLARIGVPDLIVIAVKAPALAGLVSEIGLLCGPKTLLLPAMNGIPWWFVPGLQSVDPQGQLQQHLPTSQVLGCVVHASSTTPEPGLVFQKAYQHLLVGLPKGNRFSNDQNSDIHNPPAANSGALNAVVEVFNDAGLLTQAVDNIEYHLWFKLWGNMTINPISALTGSTADRILDDPLVRQLCSNCMLEAKAIGEKIGCVIDQDPEDRHQITRGLGAFRTSMLQDAEQGRPIELDALLGAVRELGQLHAVKTPYLDALFGLTRLMAQQKNLYPRN